MKTAEGRSFPAPASRLDLTVRLFHHPHLPIFRRPTPGTHQGVIRVTELSFAVRAAQLLDQILEQLEAIDALEDLEMDLVDGVLTVTFDDGGKIIINRQEATEQIWVASPLGPAHFNFDDAENQWVNDRSGESLAGTLERAFSEKMREEIELEGGF